MWQPIPLIVMVLQGWYRAADGFLKCPAPNRVMNVLLVGAVVLNAVAFVGLCSLMRSITVDTGKGRLTALEERIVERERHQEEQQRRRMLGGSR